jgi:nucleoside-diphosphate-sugar epimerase
MRIVIAGGHGKIAMLLSRLLAEAGHEPIGLIRNPDHADDLLAVGATPVVLDLEQTEVGEVADVLKDVDAVVFAAGAGPGSSAERKLTLDRDGAILVADAAEDAGVRRLIVISAIGADDFDPESGEVFQVYLRAKSEADAVVRGRDLDWTIVRPGSLTDDAPTGLVAVGETVDRGRIPRADVADLVAQLIVENAAIRRQFEVVAGDTPVPEAVLSL